MTMSHPILGTAWSATQVSFGAYFHLSMYDFTWQHNLWKRYHRHPDDQDNLPHLKDCITANKLQLTFAKTHSYHHH